jgi:hypothetical protein
MDADKLFVDSRRHDRKDRSNYAELIRHWSLARNYDRISEPRVDRVEGRAAILEHLQSIGKMVHRVDAKARQIIIERQWGIGVRDFKGYSVSLIGAGHAQIGGSDSCFICVDARDSATHTIGEIARGSAGSTGDFESLMLRSKIKPRKEPIVFFDCGPTVLTNVRPKSHLDRLKDLFGEMALGAIEINAFCHGEGLSVDRCGPLLK